MSGPPRGDGHGVGHTAQLRTAAEWDEWHRAGRARLVPFRESEWVNRNLAPTSGMSAVDLGCGTGQWTRQLFRWGMHATGYDFSHEALRQARSGGVHPRLVFGHWDINTQRPPSTLEPHSVDVVTCRWAVAYLNPSRFLTTVTWLLKPHGTLYLLTSLHPPAGDHLDRGLSQVQLAQLMSGWQWFRTRDFNRTSRAILLRGYGRRAEGNS